eukprot:987770_1
MKATEGEEETAEMNTKVVEAEVKAASTDVKPTGSGVVDIEMNGKEGNTAADTIIDESSRVSSDLPKPQSSEDPQSLNTFSKSDDMVGTSQISDTNANINRKSIH